MALFAQDRKHREHLLTVTLDPAVAPHVGTKPQIVVDTQGAEHLAAFGRLRHAARDAAVRRQCIDARAQEVDLAL